MSSDFKNRVIKELDESSILSALSRTSWKSIDTKIRIIIHFLRLFVTFTDEPSASVKFWKKLVIHQVNKLIFVRNSKLLFTTPTSQYIKDIEASDFHGPLGIILHHARINDDINKTNNKLKIVHVRCSHCQKRLVRKTFIISKENDIHAPWNCPYCKSIQLERLY